MVPKINIMHIRDSSGIFGAERVILTIAKNIDRSDFHFNLMCMRRGDGKSDRLISTARNLGISVFPVDVRGKLDLGALRRIRCILREQQAKIIHTHDFKSDFYGLLATLCNSTKRVATAHGSTRDSLKKKLYLFFAEHGTYRFFHKVIAVSKDLREHLLSLNLAVSKVATIQNGIDFSLIDGGNSSSDAEPLPNFNGKKVFSVIGRLFPDKGHRFFLEAFKTVHHSFPNTAGMIVGDGPERTAIVEHIKVLALENIVHLCNVRNDMKTVYQMTDYVVIPSLTEGLPYVLLEAMASQLPLIATAVGDIPLLIHHGRTGFLVNPGSVDELQEYMRRLVINPEEAKIMATRGHELVFRKYSAERTVRATETLYRNLINDNS